MVECKKCPLRKEECKRLNEELSKEYSFRGLTLCPLKVLADDVFARYCPQEKQK